MDSDIIVSTPDRVSVKFEGTQRDVLTTIGFGILRSVQELSISNDPDSYNDGVLNIHIDGSPSKIAVVKESFDITSVTALVFADLGSGIHRIGFSPQEGQGEVLVVMIMDSDMPDSTLARAGVTITEGITAAIQDLGLAYDSMTASGSVRQNVVTVCDKGASLYLRGAGKHCKLGELIGVSTIRGVKRSAAANGTDIGSRRSAASMLASYGYDRSRLAEISDCTDLAHFMRCMAEKDSDPVALAAVSAVLHVYNEVHWGLLAEDIGREVMLRLMRSGLREPVGDGDIIDVLALTLAKYYLDSA
jgi:hypothetical protein